VLVRPRAPDLEGRRHWIERLSSSIIDELAGEYGTPLYVIHSQTLRERYHEFVTEFEKRYSNSLVFYAYKANYLPAVCEQLHRLGCGAEVASGMELELAMALNVNPQQIAFNGPLKTENDLFHALSSGVKYLNADSPEELRELDVICRRRRTKASVGIRVNTDVDLDLHGFRSKFGIDIARGHARECVKLASRLSRLKLVGLHTHIGTQIMSPNHYSKALSQIIQFLEENGQFAHSLEYVDVGGGFPSNSIAPLGLTEAVPPIGSFATKIAEEMKRLSEKCGHEIKLLLEPGRYLVTDSITLLLRVVRVKECKTETFVVLDGGTNLVPTVRNLGLHHDLVVPGTRRTERGLKTVVGPLCSEYDTFLRGEFPLVKEGDIVAVPCVGAYDIPLSPQFLFPRAGAVLLDDGKSKLVRNRETMSHVFSLDSIRAS